MASSMTRIGAATHIKGAISGEGPLSVSGRVEGQIALSETLTVEVGGLVSGEARASEVIVHGRVEGQIVATTRLTLSSSARVTGQLDAPLIRIDDGARFRGEVLMEAASSPRPSASSPAQRASFTSPTASASADRAAPSPPTRAQAPTAQGSRQPASAPSASTSPSRAQNGVALSAPRGALKATTAVVVESDDEDEDTSAVQVEGGEEYEEHTVKELREELRRRDLPVSGTKQELIERLVTEGSA